MGHPDGAHTHGSGGNDGWLAILAIVAVVVFAGPIAAAVAGLLEIVLIGTVVAIAFALAGGTFLVIRHLRHVPEMPLTPDRTRGGYLAGGTPVNELPVPPPSVTARPAIERHVENHLHFHGVSAEEVARIMRGMER